MASSGYFPSCGRRCRLHLVATLKVRFFLLLFLLNFSIYLVNVTAPNRDPSPCASPYTYTYIYTYIYTYTICKYKCKYTIFLLVLMFILSLRRFFSLFSCPFPYPCPSSLSVSLSLLFLLQNRFGRRFRFPSTSASCSWQSWSP